MNEQDVRRIVRDELAALESSEDPSTNVEAINNIQSAVFNTFEDCSFEA